MKLLPLCNLTQKQDGSKLTQFLAVSTASISLFMAGLHGGWPGPSLPKIMSTEYNFKLTVDEASYIAIIGPIGDVFGGILASTLVDKIGRKRTILSIVLPQALSFGLIYLSMYSNYLLYCARILGGIGEGATLAILPIYIAEVAQPEIRGLLGTFVTFTFLFGMLFINVVGSYVNIHTMALICLVFPVIFLYLFYAMPDSPYFLLMKNKTEKALDALKMLRRNNNVEKEMLMLTNDVKRQMSESGSYKDLFTIKTNRKALWFVSIARMFQQYTGCTAFAMYIQIMIKDATNISPVLGSSLILLTQIAGTVCSTFFIDKFGRKPLITFSSATCFLTLIIQAIFFTLRDYTYIDVSYLSWFPLLMMALFILCFACGLGVILNIFASEIYSASIKSKATSIGSVIYAFCMMSSTKFYQYTADNFGLAVPFYSFAVIEFFGVLFYTLILPETKGKTLEQIQQELKGNTAKTRNLDG